MAESPRHPKPKGHSSTKLLTKTTDQSEVFRTLAKLNKSILMGLVKLRGEPPVSRSKDLALMLEEVLWSAQETRILLKELQASSRSASETSIDQATQTRKSWKKSAQVSQKQWTKMQEFAQQVHAVVDTGAEQGLPVIGVSHHKHEAWCERSYKHVVPSIQHWADMLLDDQHQNVRTDRQMKRDASEAEKMVTHFQRLFDVPAREAVYTRMTDIYQRQQELTNILHTLKCLLGLDEDVPANRVVVALSRLCDLHSDTSTRMLSHLLQTENLERLILRLDQYHKFFPVFEDIAKDLIEILGVETLGQVVPAVRALKLLHPW